MQRIISAQIGSALSPSTVSSFVEAYTKLVRHHGCHLVWSRAGRPMIVPANEDEQKIHLESIKADPGTDSLA